MSDDLFDDEKGIPTEGESKEFAVEPKEPEQIDEPKVEEPEEEGEKEVTPPVTEEKTEKLIPEHRFKAALKDVTDKYEKAQQELDQLKALPVPSREDDPDGYELHVRIETSKAVMRSTHEDYDEKIAHYNEMVKSNPLLNQVVAAHPVPAQHAYNLAKEDLEIQNLKQLSSSDDWKEFQEFKKMKANKTVEEPEQKKVTPSVPNLNRVTSLSKGKSSNDTFDEDLFKGAL